VPKSGLKAVHTAHMLSLQNESSILINVTKLMSFRVIKFTQKSVQVIIIKKLWRHLITNYIICRKNKKKLNIDFLRKHAIAKLIPL